MNEVNNIEDILYHYFYKHPLKTLDDVISIAKRAEYKAKRERIPVYKARKIENLNGIPDEYESSTAVIRHQEYKDESTFEDDYYDYED